MNILLDYFLIFGTDIFGIEIKPMGMTGAAVSTAVSMVIQLTILVVVFFSAENDRKYFTRNVKVHLNYFKECIAIGLPNSISHFLEISAWYAAQLILVMLGSEYVTITNINTNFFFLLVCINDCIQKSLISFASNLIGLPIPSLRIS